jgi:hypothetical protein
VRFALATLAASGCVDCGETDVCVLDFDHVGSKTRSVMELAHREVGLGRLRQEIERCLIAARPATGAARRASAATTERGRRYPQRESNSRYEIENLAC